MQMINYFRGVKKEIMYNDNEKTKSIKLTHKKFKFQFH